MAPAWLAWPSLMLAMICWLGATVTTGQSGESARRVVLIGPPEVVEVHMQNHNVNPVSLHCSEAILDTGDLAAGTASLASLGITKLTDTSSTATTKQLPNIANSSATTLQQPAASPPLPPAASTVPAATTTTTLPPLSTAPAVLSTTIPPTTAAPVPPVAYESSQWSTKLRLPVFTCKEQLLQDEWRGWRTYLDQVYGLATLSYPVRPSSFVIFYDAGMPSDLREQIFPRFASLVNNNPNPALTSLGDVYRIKFVATPPYVAIHAYGTMNRGQRGPPGPFLAKYPDGFPSNSLVEVVHECGDKAGQGYWMFLAPGSGHFLELGRTKAFLTHKSGCEFFGGTWQCQTFWAINNFVRAAGRKAGYDTVQYMDHYIGGGLSVFEVVDLRGDLKLPQGLTAEHLLSLSDQELDKLDHTPGMSMTPHFEQTCPPSTQAMHSGWGGGAPCFCESNQPFLNCRRDMRDAWATHQAPVPGRRRLLAAGTASKSVQASTDGSFQLDLVLTGDIHGHTDNAAPLAYMVSEMRRKMPNVLVLDAGDAFVGSAFFTKFGPTGMAKLMALIKYDVMALGNHDMEYEEELAGFSRQSGVPVVSVNVGMPGVKRSVVLEAGGRRIGVTAYTDAESSNLEDYRFISTRDYVLSMVRIEAARLRQVAKCDAVIVLGHGGIEFDLFIANHSKGLVDAVMAGHSHILYYSPCYDMRTPIVLHAGQSGSHLGHMRLIFGADGRLQQAASQVFALENREDKDATVAAWLAEKNLILEQERGAPIALVEYKGGDSVLPPAPPSARRFPVTDSQVCRERPCMMGRFVSRVMHMLGQCVVDKLDLGRSGSQSVFALREAGSIRSQLLNGPMYMADLREVLVWDNELLLVEITFAKLKDMLRHSLKSRNENGGGAYLHAFGLHYGMTDGKLWITRDFKELHDHSSCCPTTDGQRCNAALMTDIVVRVPPTNGAEVPSAEGADAGLPILELEDKDKVLIVITKWIFDGGDGYAEALQDAALVGQIGNEVELFCALLHGRACEEGQPLLKKATAVMQAFGGALGAMVSMFLTYGLLMRQARQAAGHDHDATAMDTLRICCYCWEMYPGKWLAVASVGVSSFVFWFFFYAAAGFLHSNFASAVLGGVLNVVITTPIWVVITRMQMHPDTGIAHQVAELWENHGVAGFFKGLLPNLMMISFPVVQSNCYVFLVNYVLVLAHEPSEVTFHAQNPIAAVILASMATIIATIITYPVQVVRVRLQASVPLLPASTSTLDILTTYYRGVLTKILHSSMNASILFLFKEQVVAAIVNG